MSRLQNNLNVKDEYLLMLNFIRKKATTEVYSGSQGICNNKFYFLPQFPSVSAVKK